MDAITPTSEISQTPLEDFSLSIVHSDSNGQACLGIDNVSTTLQPTDRKVSICSQLVGSFFAFLTVFMVSANTLVIKLNPEINISWFLIWQGVSMFCIQSSLTALTKGNSNFTTSIRKNWLAILIKVTVIFFMVPIVFRVIPEMPFGDLSVILTCGPCLLVAVLAFVIFGEKLTKFQVSLIGLSSVGVICIIRPAFIFGISNADQVYPNRLVATIVCIGLACLITAQILAVRKMGFSINAYLLNIFVGASLTISGVTYQQTFASGDLYNPYFCANRVYASFIIVSASVMASFISPFEALALQRTKAAVFASIGTSKVVLDYVIQLAFFPEEGIFWSTILGAIVVTFTAFDLSVNLDVVFVQWLKKRKMSEIQRKISVEKGLKTDTETPC